MMYASFHEQNQVSYNHGLKLTWAVAQLKRGTHVLYEECQIQKTNIMNGKYLIQHLLHIIHIE